MSTQNGMQIYVSQPNNTPNEQWQIFPVEGEKHTFYIKSFCGKALDVFEGKTDNETPVIQWDFHGKKNQMWQIKEAWSLSLYH